MKTESINRRKYGKMIFLLIIAVWLLSGTAAGAAEAAETEKEAVSIYFFHNTACGTCDGTEEFRGIVEEQIADYREVCPYKLMEYNVFKTGGKDEWDAIAEEYSLENENYVFPVMVLDGTMYTGIPEIRAQLHSAFLKAAGVSALYFYRKDCQECLDMELFWEQFPPYFLLKLESRTDHNGELIRRLFERYQVPDDDQMVPFVFLKDSYLAGQQDIEKNLLRSLEEGDGFLSAEEGTGGSGDEAVVSESGRTLE